MTIEETLEQLDSGIRRLKVQYDMFFTGALKRQPYEIRRQVDQMIRTISGTAIKKYQVRFQFSTLVGRYNALSELWAKQLRASEEGGRAAVMAAPRARPAQSKPAAADSQASSGEEVFFAIQVSDPETEPGTMRVLYDRYIEARHTGQGRSPLAFESFVKQIAKQASTLKASSGCESLEFRVLRKGDSVSLKARAGKQES